MTTTNTGPPPATGDDETEAEAREAQDRAVLEQAGYVACLRPEAIGPERRARVIGSILAMAKERAR